MHYHFISIGNMDVILKLKQHDKGMLIASVLIASRKGRRGSSNTEHEYFDLPNTAWCYISATITNSEV